MWLIILTQFETKQLFEYFQWFCWLFWLLCSPTMFSFNAKDKKINFKSQKYINIRPSSKFLSRSRSTENHKFHLNFILRRIFSGALDIEWKIYLIFGGCVLVNALNCLKFNHNPFSLSKCSPVFSHSVTPLRCCVIEWKGLKSQHEKTRRNRKKINYL